MRDEVHREDRAIGPIGRRLARWRRRQNVAASAFADQVGLSRQQLLALETGEDWADRRSLVAALAQAMRLDLTELTGQPYRPSDREHHVVRAVASHVRRHLIQVSLGQEGSAGTLGDLEARTEAALTAEEAGDEYGLGLALPGLLALADQTVAASVTGREPTARLRAQVYAVAAGLLRRVGYRDLVWMLLHQVGPERGVRAVLIEEMRLLLDLGFPDHALNRARRGEEGHGSNPELLLAAVAHAVAGRRDRAEQHIATAAARAQNDRQMAAAASARVVIALEVGAADEAAAHAGAVDFRTMVGAEHVDARVVAATATARQGRISQASAHLVAAHSLSPLRVRLSPVARELLSVLPARATAEDAATLRRIAALAGLH
ncbi:DNA-binding protein [Streptomyces botrytidirepellens]|uniref:DNA-binding protein n=1 Tax=Streptomyces botrytidirepellens TaxID=2486417 RepID=A0A3M8WCE4_9ACTN|nr:DNA-binding protein [Streptomyces botrytidirepellens]RNG26245.1 DNA-binding protein [Streptomyces botrytidirepellens]